MEAGTIGTWHVAAGDSFNAGDVIAEIETDKATMGFEAQDPGVVAKILVEAGNEVSLPIVCSCARQRPLPMAATAHGSIIRTEFRLRWDRQL